MLDTVLGLKVQSVQETHDLCPPRSSTLLGEINDT